MPRRHAINFFDSQFHDQIAAAEFALNSFETAALPYLSGDVLDLGCGLGNLALAAAGAGCSVTALDGSTAAIARLAAAAAGLPVVARQADFGHDAIAGDYDAVVAIGLLMFFPRPRSTDLLAAIKAATRPGGVAVVNALTEGTTFLDMFGVGHYTLFGRDEIAHAFAGWEVLESRHDGFDAPRGTRKEFATVIARRPAA